MLETTYILDAGKKAAQASLFARRNYTRWGIEKPIKDLLDCIEHSPDNIELAVAAAKGKLELESDLSPAQAKKGYPVIDLVVQGLGSNILWSLGKKKDILSAYVLAFREERARLSEEKQIELSEEEAKSEEDDEE